MPGLKNSITDTLQLLPFSLDILPTTACLVGGAVRDACLKREQDYIDLDFVLPEFAVETAKKIAHHYHAGFVVLDQQRQIARVVFPQGTVDFALQEGDNLTKDLQRRDFTVNAIAYNPHTAQLIDPLDGLSDIKGRVLRMVCGKNLEDDPLRLLRAYRQAAQLNFTIDSRTRASIRKRVGLLGKVAAERVQTELNHLLSHPHGNVWLKEAAKDNLLRKWLPSINADNLQRVASVELAVEQISESLNDHRIMQVQDFAGEYFSTRDIQTAKLACLVSQLPKQAESELLKLKYPRWETRSVLMILKNLHWLQSDFSPMDLRQQYFFFLEIGTILPIMMLVAWVSGGDRRKIIDLFKRYLNPSDRVAHVRPLITGRDLLQHLEIKPGPKIGQLLTEVQIAHIEGKINNKEEALAFAGCLASQE